jgi:hypothetical protein
MRTRNYTPPPRLLAAFGSFVFGFVRLGGGGQKCRFVQALAALWGILEPNLRGAVIASDCIYLWVFSEYFCQTLHSLFLTDLLWMLHIPPRSLCDVSNVKYCKILGSHES